MNDLLKEALEDCVMLDKVTTDDGYGGFYQQWIEGAKFQAAFYLDTSVQARIADQQDVKDVYTVTTSKSVNLDFHDVFKRLSDGQVFRSTTYGKDKKTPKSANIDMRQVQAEVFELVG